MLPEFAGWQSPVKSRTYRSVLLALVTLFIFAIFYAFASESVTVESLQRLAYDRLVHEVSNAAGNNAYLVVSSRNATSINPSALPSFYEIGSKYGTAKVTVHAYHHMYSKYLEPVRHEPLKFLEIGLDCDVNHRPGKRYYTWLEYLPNVALYYIESDAECANEWAGLTTNTTISTSIGDQSDPAFLNKFIREHGLDFDVIIDDGGHTMEQQVTSFHTLMRAVKPGGLYFVEDLNTSYQEVYGGGLRGTAGTMMGLVKTALDDLMESRNNIEIDVMKDVLSVDCMAEICVFTKKNREVESLLQSLSNINEGE